MATSQFYVTLPNTSSSQFFPDNKLSSFTTNLHTPLRLNGDWEVALVEINYPRTWYNVSGDTCKVYYTSTHDQELKSVKIPPGYYETVEEILYELRKTLPPHILKDVHMYVKSQSRKLVINCSNGSAIKFNETLARMLGFEEANLIRKDTYGTFPVDIHRGFYTLYVYTDIVSTQYVGDT